MGHPHGAHSHHDHGHHGHGHHGHDHAHPHHGGAGHVHAPKDFGRAFAIGITLNVGFVVAEAVFGFVSNSTALLADAGHNLSDVFGLVIAWIAAVLSRRAPRGRFTYGLRGSSILAALLNGILLLVAVGAIGLEAFWRFGSPEPVVGSTVMIVAAIGILINGATALMFMGGKSDINIQGAYLHMLADAAVSAGVVVSAALIIWTGWFWIDPLVSLAICIVILWSTVKLLRSAVDMSLGAVPVAVDLEAVRAALMGRPGVGAIHDLHVWPISTTETALTCHLVMPAGHPGDLFLSETATLLAARHGICHTTLQIEIDSNCACALSPHPSAVAST